MKNSYSLVHFRDYVSVVFDTFETASNWAFFAAAATTFLAAGQL